jgi:hypothetical protein
MSIGPVRDLPPAPEPQLPESKTRAIPAPPPALEQTPSQETAAAKNAPPVPTAPQDEVRVQWDNPMADYVMIYQFVNQQSGSLVLQIPDDQVLSLIHQVREMLQNTEQQAAAVSSAPPKLPNKE